MNKYTHLYWLMLLATLSGCQAEHKPLELVEFDAVIPTPKPHNLSPAPPSDTQTSKHSKVVPDGPAGFDLTATLESLRATFSPIVESATKWIEPPPGLLPKPEDRKLICYTASWCAPCQQMHPVWDRLRKQGFKVVLVDVDHPPAWAKDYKPGLLPAMGLFVNKQQVATWTGIVAEQTLVDALSVGKGIIDPKLGRVLESPIDPKLVVYASQSAKIQADRNKQGHFDWNNRFQQITSATGYRDVQEICAESWDRETNASESVLWKSMFDSWRQSPGHWSVANRYHAGYGAAMAKGSNGIHYAAIIVGNQKQPSEYSTTEDKEDSAEKDLTGSSEDSKCDGGNCKPRLRRRK